MDCHRSIDNSTQLDESADTADIDLVPLRYAEELRAIGQALEGRAFTSIELEVTGDGYWVWAETDQSRKADLSFGAIVRQLLPCFGSLLQTKKQAAKRAVEVCYRAEEIQKLIEEGTTQRLVGDAVPDPFTLSSILRQTGAYVDNLDHATLVRIAVKERRVTICYMTGSGQLREFRQDIQFFYDYWVKMYLHRCSRRRSPQCQNHATYLTRH